MKIPQRLNPRPIVYLLILSFWVISIWHLDRFPAIHEDEPWILSPGYKFFAQGIYGSDLFAGFYGMEQHYLEFMPLMSLLLGAGTRLWGVGILQMRFLPVVLGTLTLALSFALARKWANSWIGLITLFLLIFWQWTPDGARRLASGIPFVDVPRLARYDILAALLGLGALVVFTRAREAGQRRYDFLTGLLAGLAGLAHLYGLFWVPVLLGLLLFDGIQANARPRCGLRSAGLLVSGVVGVGLIWMAAILLHWKDFLGQTLINQDRFDLLNPSFYLNNLLTEPQRYSLGVRDPQTFVRSGFWLLIVGVPIAWLWLGLRTSGERDRQMRWSLVPCLLLPLLFALLINRKSFTYVVSLAPLFCLLMAWGLDRLLHARAPAWRALAVTAIVVILIQGGQGLGRMQVKASQAPPPEELYAALRKIVPFCTSPGTSRVLVGLDGPRVSHVCAAVCLVGSGQQPPADFI